MDKPSVRRIDRPVRVVVDPARLWMLPRKAPKGQSIGLRARAFATQPANGEWLPGTLFAWVLLYTTGAVWYGEVAVTLHARNNLQDVTVRQWIPADSVRKPTPDEARRLQW
ncbi:hypothetical protein [Nocardia blacklockiae]|uniref:hypothetical protein n=1 Tax=Nocardia blacklockiae TaxID=480036 RepID=UPI001895B547|nr:hypothetical protein [Nocardia blacklockiae]MBF6174398.1 hypothetical protein [Nocardia blacklockiae]